MKKLRFGTAGIPILTPDYNTINGVKYVRKLGLGCMEIAFVRSVYLSEEMALEIKEVAKKHDVKLTCHAPYYINLNSEEKAKIEASKKRIFNAARISSLCGASSVTFHAAYYMKSDIEKTYQMVKQGIKEILDYLDEEGINIWIRPETTGKPSQWGSLQEILRLSKELEGVLPCIDFSHLHARSMAEVTDTEKVNSYQGFCNVLKEVEKILGRKGLDNMHIHVSGIEYSGKGERWHLELSHSDFKWKELLRALKDFDCKGIVISESPNIEKDALMMQKFYNTL
ncbi:TIM barrel protein [Nanoarchaeota archaeon]